MKSNFTEIKLSCFPPKRNAIGFGADSKNTVAFVDTKSNTVSFSENHGPLLDPEAASKFEKTVSEILKSSNPEFIAVDLHPDYYATVHGERNAERLGVPLLQVQHHHAHAVSCMAEHGLDESLALVFDGTGYGIDGNLWGAELFYVNHEGFKRLATFAPAPLPGGDVSVREPLRQLFGRIFFPACNDKPDLIAFCKRYDLQPDIADVWCQQLEKNINCPRSHSVGRLFDSVSVLLGCAPKIAREAEAAISLQNAAESCQAPPDPSLMPFEAYEEKGLLLIDWTPLFIHSINYSQKHLFSQKKLLALSFHHSLALAAQQMAEFGFAKFATRNIVLSGGVFMNKLLLGLLKSKLGKMKVFSHEKTPTNDCGISIGQAVIAAGNTGF